MAIVLLGTLLVSGAGQRDPVAGAAVPSLGTSAVPVSAAAYIHDAPTLGRQGWAATAGDQVAGHGAGTVLDGNADTYWEGQLGPSGAGASVTVDMGRAQVVSGLVYEPRQGTGPAGSIGEFAVGVSTDGVHFSTVASGTWADDTAVKQVGMAPVTARFVRLTGLSTASGDGTAVTAAELYLEGRPRVSGGLGTDGTRRGVQSAATLASRQSTDPAVVGEWGPVIGFPLVPVAAALLPHNQLLVWSADQDLSSGSGSDDYTETAILNLTTGAVSQALVTDTDHNMFCPGVAILADGDVMVTGGLSDQQTSIYDPTTNSWSAGPRMNIGRGYNGMTLLADEQAFTLGGSWSGASGDKLAEVWSPSAGWRELTKVPATAIYTHDAQGAYRADNHGWFIATSGGEVLQAGPSKQMNWITTTGSGSITPAGHRGTSGDAMNGNAVYYDTGKVLTLGGSPSYQNSTATNAAYVVTIAKATTKKGSTERARTTRVGSMAYARAFANSVFLPSGEVVTMGGQTYAVPYSDQNSILDAELWHPGTGKFSVLAPEAEPRDYHSVAVLLPDGRVFSGGGGLCGFCSTNHPDGQIFTPPYLLNANGTEKVRPTITTAPTSAATGQTITVTTGGPVSQFSMVRYGESTHSTDNDQRRIPLAIVSTQGDTYRLAIPADPGIALPGPYMLFALNSSGTPSVSTTITVTNVPTRSPGDAYGKAVFAAAPALYWPLTGAGGSAAADRSGNGDTGDYSTTGITYRSPSPVEAASGTGVTLNGSSGQIVASQPTTDPTTYSEDLWFKTTTATGGLLMGFGSSAGGTSASRDRLVWMSDDGQLNFGIFSGQTAVAQSPSSYNDGRWHNVVATDGSAGIDLYVDGQLVASNASPGPPEDYLGYWRVGGETLTGWPDSSTSNYFSGTIADAAVFDAQLPAATVQSLYRASPAA